MTRKTIAIPAYILNDDTIVQLCNALTEVGNEIGTDPESTAAFNALMDELDSRATTTYQLINGKIIRKEAP